jgi:hypothetical protein
LASTLTPAKGIRLANTAWATASDSSPSFSWSKYPLIEGNSEVLFVHALTWLPLLSGTTPGDCQIAEEKPKEPVVGVVLIGAWSSQQPELIRGKNEDRNLTFLSVRPFDIEARSVAVDSAGLLLGHLKLSAIMPN